MAELTLLSSTPGGLTDAQLDRNMQNLNEELAGKMPLVSFGLGADDVPLFSGNADTLLTTGMYGATGAATGMPAGWVGGTLFVIGRLIAGGATSQLAFEAGTKRVASRAQSGGVFSAWEFLWNTASLVKTVGVVDTTVGRMLKVADFGLGGDAIPLSNPDVAIAAGYTHFGELNSGLGAGAMYPLGFESNWEILTHAGTNDNRCSQIAIELGTGRVATRSRSGGVNTAWKEVWTSGNLAKTESAYDTTVGRVLKVGDYGLGGLTSALTAAQLDGTKVGGAVSTLGEGWSPYSSILTLGYHNAGYATQISSVQGNNYPLLRVRNLNAGVWGQPFTLVHSGNILGPVSQSGGLPTGAIIERGSNANGNWTKFADGLCVVTTASVALVGGLGSVTLPITVYSAMAVAMNEIPTNFWSDKKIHCYGGGAKVDYHNFGPAGNAGTFTVIGYWF